VNTMTVTILVSVTVDCLHRSVDVLMARKISATLANRAMVALNMQERAFMQERVLLKVARPYLRPCTAATAARSIPIVPITPLRPWEGVRVDPSFARVLAQIVTRARRKLSVTHLMELQRAVKFVLPTTGIAPRLATMTPVNTTVIVLGWRITVEAVSQLVRR
jgi:hypothetical protein